MHRFVSGVLIAVLTGLMFALPAAAQEGDNWPALQESGVGTRVKLKFRTGGEATGTVLEARPDAVLLGEIDPQGHGLISQGSPGPNGERLISRSTVALATVIGKVQRYKAAMGQKPDAALVRSVVMTLGEGRKVDVQTEQSKIVRGMIKAFEDDTFTVIHEGGTTDVTYGEVTNLKPVGLHRGAKTAIIAVSSSVAVFLIIWMNSDWTRE